MLRELLTRFRRAPTPPPAIRPRPSAPPFRRKSVFERLESRLLLSADPVALFGTDGVLELVLGDGDDRAIVERLGASDAGGDIVAVSFGAVTEQYGNHFLGVMRLLIDAGAGDDWLRIVGVTAMTDVIGGLGTDTFEWQRGDATWSITALDTGTVETVSFSTFEHLVGADDRQDTFLFTAGATVSGRVEGGAGGFDSIVITGGDYQRITVTTSAPDAGAIALDDRTLRYGGIEPVTIDAASADLTLNATAGDDVVRLGDAPAAGQSALDGLNGTFGYLAFVNPTALLTINLGGGDDAITIGTLDGGFAAALDIAGGDGRDRIAFTGTVATRGHDLFASAEAIVVAPAAAVRTDLGPGGTAGDIVFAAADSTADASDAAQAAVTIGGGTLIGRNIVILATAEYDVDATAPAEPGGPAAFLDGESIATVEIFGASRILAADALTIKVRSAVAAEVDAPADPGAAADGGSALTVLLDSTAAARIGDTAALSAGGDLAIHVANEADLVVHHGRAVRAAVTLETIVEAGDAASLSGRGVSLRADSDADVVAPLVEFDSVTRAGVADGALVIVADAMLLGVAAMNRIETASGGRDDARAERRAFGAGEARVPACTLDIEAMLEGDAATSVYPAEDGVARAFDATAPRIEADLSDDPGDPVESPSGTARSTPPFSEPGDSPAETWGASLLPAHAVSASPEAHEGASTFVVGAFLVGADSGDDGAPLTPGTGLVPGAPAVADDDGESGGLQRSSRAGADSTDGDGDAAVATSLALSLLNDSMLFELVRNVASSGAMVLSASGAVPMRGRARGPSDAGEPDSTGALEIGAGDAAAAAETAFAAESAAPSAADPETIAIRRDGPHSAVGALVLATAVRHDLIGEASGGAERGTAITPVASIDVTNVDAAAARDGADTFTLADPSGAPDDATFGDAAFGDSPDAGGIRHGGIVLSMQLPPLRFEVRVGGADPVGMGGVIRVGDVAETLAHAHDFAESGLLDSSGSAGERRNTARDRDARAAPEQDDSRAVLAAYLGVLAAPIAATFGLTRELGAGVAGGRRHAFGGSLANVPWLVSRVQTDGRPATCRGGGTWIGDFVNGFSLYPDEQNPNAKIRIKL